MIKQSSPPPSIKELLIFSIPQLALMLCHICISFTDIWVTAKMGESVQAGLGIVTQYYMVIMLVASFAGSGFSSSIAQALGAKNKRRAKYYVFCMLCICFVFACFVGAFSLLLLQYTTVFYGDNKELYDVIFTFLFAYCLNLPFYYLMVMMNSTLRAYKLTKIPCQTLALVCVVNFIASLGFGLGLWGLPNFSYAGVAYATTLSGVVGCLFNFWNLWRLNLISSKSIPSLQWARQALPYVFRIGIPAGISGLVSQSGSFLIMLIILTLPTNTENIIAGMSVGARLQSIILFIMGAISISLGILVGHLMGGQEYGAIKRFGQKSVFLSFVLASLFSFILYMARNILVPVFSADTLIAEQAFYYLNYACLMIPFMCASSVLSGVFSGTGANRLSAYINVGLMWCINLPLSYVLAKTFNFGISGVYSISLLVSICNFAFLGLFFMKGTWQKYGLIRKRKRETGV